MTYLNDELNLHPELIYNDVTGEWVDTSEISTLELFDLLTDEINF